MDYCISLMQTAGYDQDLAKDLADEGRYEVVVFYAALAGEMAGSALLVTLGGRPSRRHRMDGPLETSLRVRAVKMPEDVRKVIDELKWLEPHVIISRYHVKVHGKCRSPSTGYRKVEAQQALAFADDVVRVDEKHLEKQLR